MWLIFTIGHKQMWGEHVQGEASKANIRLLSFIIFFCHETDNGPDRGTLLILWAVMKMWATISVGWQLKKSKEQITDFWHHLQARHNSGDQVEVASPPKARLWIATVSLSLGSSDQRIYRSVEKGVGVKEFVAIFHLPQSTQISSSCMKNAHSLPKPPMTYPIMALI